MSQVSIKKGSSLKPVRYKVKTLTSCICLELFLTGPAKEKRRSQLSVRQDTMTDRGTTEEQLRENRVEQLHLCLGRVTRLIKQKEPESSFSAQDNHVLNTERFWV